MREFDKLITEIARVTAAVGTFEAAMTKEAAETLASQLRPTPENQPFIEALRAGDAQDYPALAAKIRAQYARIDGRAAFKLYDTYGFPIEITTEMAKEKKLTVDAEGFEARFKQHQEKSHAGAEQRFKGGLADTTEETAKLHTATHLLHAALRKVLGGEVAQKGSNITAERLRFDFSFPRRMTDEEIAEVEGIVNSNISTGGKVLCEEMTVDEAKAAGAIGLFESKYGERVKVYTMGTFSKEICGGPHASEVADLKSFKILKEESSSAGVRRIKAVVGK
jgi:alanyl-tRNA synthetase